MDFKFKSVSLYIGYILIKPDVECKSGDENLGSFLSVNECANACKSTEECKYFIYGKNKKKGRCYWENTTGSSCTEGWEADNFDFYQIEGKFPF